MSTYQADPHRYDASERGDHAYRRSGRSGLLLPAVSLGLWNNFGDDRPLEGQRAIVRRAFDLGITHFDLANNYGPGPGAAERNFGRILASDFAGHRDEMVISTKSGYDMWAGPHGEWGSRKHMLASLDQSLARLDLSYVDIYYSHRPDPHTPVEETVGALVTAVHSGRAIYVGVSNYSVEQTRAVSSALAAERVPLLIHQPRYNMLDRAVEQGLLSTAAELGFGLIAFSPLAQGLLTDRYLDGVPETSRAAAGRWLSGHDVSQDHLRRVRALQAIARDRGQSVAQMAIAWVLRHDTMTSALVGASSVAQLESNAAALDAGQLTSAELAAIDDILAS